MSNNTPSHARRLPPWLVVIGPGILVAATGVGAGDLATGALIGSELGTAVLWAVALGAFLKFVETEGLARWQLATGTSVLEGAVRHFGRFAQVVFLVYLLIWTYLTSVALMGACGIALHAMLPLGAASTDKITYGIAHSLLAVLLVELGGFRLFEKVMSVCIGLMFVTVLLTAIAVGPAWGEVLSGLLVPRIPDFAGRGLHGTVALMGGVGGTLTVLCYGYWIREAGRESPQDIRACRIDLAAGYVMTALFGMAMVIIGSRISVEGNPAQLLVALSSELEQQLGTAVRWAFLIGAWGAIFSSLLGVWQSVPYLFADFLSLSRRREAVGGRVRSEAHGPDLHNTGITGPGLPDGQTRPPHLRRIEADGLREAINTRGLAYRGYLYAMATLPAVGLYRNFASAQKAYAIFGAMFVWLLAIALLLLNGSAARIGPEHKNSRLNTLALLVAVVLFGYYMLHIVLGG